MNTDESKRSLTEGNATVTSVFVSGQMGRPPADVAEYPNGPPQSPDRRCRGNALRLAFLADKEIAKGGTQWRQPELQSRVDAINSSVVEGVDAANS